MNIKALEAAATTVRALSMDAIEKAKSGHPGLPMGVADLGVYLFAEQLRLNPKAPKWINRDRFVLSAGHGSMLLYSLLHLSGFDISLEDIKNFRQLHSKTPGHPELGEVPGVDTTTGPLGAGLSNAVGMAMAETMLASRFNRPGQSIIDHFTYVLSGDGCMQEGVSQESISLAGHLGLGKLILFYDSNKITIEGSTDLAFTEDVMVKFAACNWQVLEGDAYDLENLASLIKQAQAEKAKPTLIKVNSIIGKGSPHKQGTHGVHGAPLGAEEIIETRKALGIPVDQDFYVAPEAADYFKNRQQQWAAEYDKWTDSFQRWAKDHPELKKELDTALSGEFDFSKVDFPSYEPGHSMATRSAGGAAINALAKAFPQLVGGSADLAPSNNTHMKDAGDYQKDTPQGRNLHFGIREHAMGGIVNGLNIHGGLRAFGATFLVFCDYMRPALRLASLMKVPSINVFTHDSIFVGEDGPTHQPIEQIESLRLIPGMLVLRPADAEETNLAWQMALSHKDRPSSLMLTRQNLTVFAKPVGWEDKILKGAYVVKDCEGTPDVVIAATGSEVTLALEAAKSSAKKVRGGSVISRELMMEQGEAFIWALFPESAKIVSAEAGVTSGWSQLTGSRAQSLGINRVGLSGPGAQVAEALGLSSENLAKLL
jgi:transketolase